ncbi:MAG: energy-coupling factor ABC transporter permease [Clostridia bacterium]|nr:energy-coupling factor ABC transporter permease [Clostridia bacterium]
MHIAEGMLPTQWWLGYSGAAAVLVAKGLIDYQKKSEKWPMFKQLTGVMTAGVFIISLMPIPVPVAGSSSHPGGTPLAAILMGPTVTAPMSVVALLFQALFLAHGGLTTLGANTLTLALFGGMVGYLVFRLSQRSGLSLFMAGALAGFLGDLAIYMGTSIQLALAIHGDAGIFKVFVGTLLAFMPTQFPLAILEGAFTGLALKYVAAHRPDILRSLGVIKGDTLPVKAKEVGEYGR